MYYNDYPIDSNEKDLLDRSYFSDILAKTIVNFENKDSYTIGIIGGWGTGKTSIVNMMEQAIEEMDKETEDETIILRFEPWHFADSTQLLTQFLLWLSNNFRSRGNKALKGIGDALKQYSGAMSFAEVIPTWGSVIAGAGKFAFRNIGRLLSPENQDILKQKAKVEKQLGKLEQKIIIIIDDIDRLSNKQIREVFQLVSAVAKFPNVIYLLVFDKEIVVKALEEIQSGDGEEYLEKIIQIPIEIPEIPESKLSDILCEKLDTILEGTNASFEGERWNNNFISCVRPFIKNLRDINRLCNLLNFKLVKIAEEVDFTDMVIISLLELSMPRVYKWIKNNKNLLIGNRIDLYFEEKDKSTKELYQKYYPQIEMLFDNENNQFEKENKVKTAINCISCLFPLFGRKIGEGYGVEESYSRKHSLISHPDKFDRYFNYDINQIDIQKTTIEEVLFSCDENTITDIFVQEDINSNVIEFVEEIVARIKEVTSERAGIIFNSMLLVSCLLKSESNEKLFSLNASSHVIHRCIEVLGQVNEYERSNNILSLIERSDLNNISSIATFINMLELGYGRYAGQGKEREYYKVVSLEQVLEIEKAFLVKLRNILEETNIFDINAWRMPLFLLECFDTDFAHGYLSEKLSDDKNIVRYIGLSVAVWHSGRAVCYELQDEYSKYLTKERIIQAINNQVNTKEIFELKDNELKKCAAFYLLTKEDKRFSDEIGESDINVIIDEWKN